MYSKKQKKNFILKKFLNGGAFYNSCGIPTTERPKIRRLGRKGYLKN